MFLWRTQTVRYKQWKGKKIWSENWNDFPLLKSEDLFLWIFFYCQILLIVSRLHFTGSLLKQISNFLVKNSRTRNLSDEIHYLNVTEIKYNHTKRNNDLLPAMIS